MNHSWNIKRLGDICTSELGKTRDEKRNKGSFRPYLCAVNVQWDKFELSELKEMRFEDNEYDRYTIRKGDLVICEGGDIGRAAIWDKDEPIHYQNALHRVRFNEGVDSRFILYYLYFLKQTGILDGRYGKGVTIKHLVKSSLLSIPVPVPPIDEQQRIVFELDLLTGIIDKKNAQLRDLDALAQSIFYEMFGDPITNDKRWGMKKVIEVVKMQRGFDLPVQDRVYTGRIPVYGSNGIVGMHSQSKVSEGIITGRSGTIGRVDCCRNPFWPLNTTLFSIDCRGNNVIYLKYLMSNFHLERFSAGAGVPTLNRNDFHEEPIIDVPIEMQVSFASKVEAIENYKIIIRQSLTENQLLLDSKMNAYFN